MPNQARRIQLQRLVKGRWWDVMTECSYPRAEAAADELRICEGWVVRLVELEPAKEQASDKAVPAGLRGERS